MWPRTFGKTDEMVFLGREISETRNYSEKIAEEIDDEVRRFIEEAQERARQLLRDKRDVLEKLVTVLMEVETLEGETLTRLLKSDPNEPWPPSDLEKKNDPPAATPTEESHAGRCSNRSHPRALPGKAATRAGRTQANLTSPPARLHLHGDGSSGSRSSGICCEGRAD